MQSEILTCEQVSKSYGNFKALFPLDLHLPSDKIIALLGPNGSGKTTLIKMIAGLLVPDSGRIKVCGEMVGPRSKAIVSYLPERSCFNKDMTTEEILMFYSSFFPDFDYARASQMLKELGVDCKRKQKFLSKGTKEKVQLVMVMSRRARLYLLDEPISGVDPAARDYIIRTIISNRNEDATVLLSTHLISDIEPYIDGFMFLRDGVLVRSGDAELTRQSEGKSLDTLFREVFRC